MAQAIEKICRVCGKDVANSKRTKDKAGNYYCQPCYENAQQRHSPPAKPLPVNAEAPTPVVSAIVQASPDLFACPSCGGMFAETQMDPSGVCIECVSRSPTSALTTAQKRTSDFLLNALIACASIVAIEIPCILVPVIRSAIGSLISIASMFSGLLILGLAVYSAVWLVRNFRPLRCSGADGKRGLIGAIGLIALVVLPFLVTFISGMKDLATEASQRNRVPNAGAPVDARTETASKRGSDKPKITPELSRSELVDADPILRRIAGRSDELNEYLRGRSGYSGDTEERLRAEWQLYKHIHYCPVKKIAKATFAFVLSRF